MGDGISIAQLSSLQLDALKEIGSIGSQNAATAMAKLVNRNVIVGPVQLDIIRLTDVPDLMGMPGEEIVATFFGLEGKLSGNMVFTFAKTDALKIVDLMMMQEVGTTKELDDMAMSAFMELGNILSSAYLSALANFFDTKFLPTPPLVITDLANELVQFVEKSQQEKIENVLLIVADFMMGNEKLRGQFMLLLTSKALIILLNDLEEKMKVRLR